MLYEVITNRVRRGFARDDLFVCVHEQFLTETAKMADIVLPATMFLEHDDLYQGGGHQHIMLGPKVVEPPAGCRSNHEVICALAERLGAQHSGFGMSPRELIDWTLLQSGWRGVSDLERERWFDVQPEFEDAHYFVITSYSIHYTKLYELRIIICRLPAGRGNTSAAQRTTTRPG